MNLLWRVGPRWQDRPSVLKVYVLVDNKQETKFFFPPKRVVLNYEYMYTWMQVPVEARWGCQLPWNYR